MVLHELGVMLSVRTLQTFTHQQVDALNDVKEDFILPISDSFASPRNSIRHSNGRPDDFKFMRFLSNVLLQDLAFCRLGVSKVHHLVEKLVDDDKVVTDRFLFQFFEVFYQDLCNENDPQYYSTSRPPTGLTPANRCKNKMISTAFEFRFDKANTD
jgi:hypothetical protein